jgi:hypothetical protein
MWWGFWLNLATGILLFCLDANHKGHQWIFAVKLGAIVAAMFVLQSERSFMFRSGQFPLADPAPAKARRFAMASLALWWVATATGRLMAYVG